MTKPSILDRAIRGIPLDDVYILDVHGHVGPYRNFYVPGLSPECTLKIMDSVGIDHAVLFSNAGMGSDHVLGNKLVKDYVAPYPDRMVPFVFINPRYPEEAISEVEYYCGKLGWKGVKIHPDGNNYPADGPNYKPVWQYISDHNLPVFSHTWDVPTCNCAVFDRVATEFPKAKIMLGHSVSEDYRGAIALVKKHPNLYLELTAAAPFNGLIEWFVREAGADRVIYGTDLGGWFSPLHGIGPVLYAKISDDDKRKILGLNAKRLIFG